MGRCIDLLKWLEDRVHLVFFDTNPCVYNIELDARVIGRGTSPDFDFSLIRELDRVIENVLKDPLDLGTIADN